MNEAARRIAVVDDEVPVCRALQRLLRLAGFEVDTFSSGKEFLDSLPVQVPDCVILDLQMPGMTGIEVQARLAETHRDVPVIIITGHDFPAARSLTLAAGAIAYLRKPVSEEMFLEAIGRCPAPPPSRL
jgi:FixJ family two-component response regulator